MDGSGREVWVTFAAKDSKVIIGRRFAQKGKVRRGEVEGLGRQNVNEGGRRGEGLDPVAGRHGGLKQQGANDIINRANNTFSFTVLRGGVGTRHSKMNAPSEEERAGSGVIKLFAIVALNGFDARAKLGRGVGEEVGDRAESVRLKSKGKSPQIMSAIIKYDQIIFKSRDANDRRRP